MVDTASNADRVSQAPSQAPSQRSRVSKAPSQAPSCNIGGANDAVSECPSHVSYEKERTTFVKMARGAKFAGDDDDEVTKFSQTQKKRVEGMMKNQAFNLPKMMPKYEGPVVATHNYVQRVHNFVITNDSHNKSTNNGFSRLAGDGRFYNH